MARRVITNLDLWDSSLGGTGSSGALLDKTRCPVQVADRGRWTTYSQCKNKPKTGEVRPLWASAQDKSVEMEVCGMHAATYDRDKAKRQEWEDRDAQSDLNKERASKAARRLLERGYKGEVEYSGGYTGKVSIDADDLTELLDKLP